MKRHLVKSCLVTICLSAPAIAQCDPEEEYAQIGGGFAHWLGRSVDTDGVTVVAGSPVFQGTERL
jgi:hypothetical protein